MPVPFSLMDKAHVIKKMSEKTVLETNVPTYQYNHGWSQSWTILPLIKKSN
jgi:hypothetical protein